ncbi:MAG TPA: bacteriohemerythrin [Steroidobacteraceae bacterium]|nr:bacteriohemerythrin [Steroidobacteraceae bacterium]
MSLLTWRPEYSIGIAAIDHEHRELIGWIDLLLEDLHLQNVEDDRVAHLLGEIYARVAAHFALEEKVMRDAGYVAIADHKEDHERLLDELRDLMEIHTPHDPANATRLAAQMTAWFSHHFRNLDAKFHHSLMKSQRDHFSSA